MLQFQALLIFLLLILTSTCNNAVEYAEEAEAESSGLNTQVLVSSLTNPWEIVWGPDGKIWFTEKDGQISRIDTGTGKVIPLYKISEVKSHGEGGLLGMAIHPDFKKSPQIVVAYNYEKNGGYYEKVVRYTYSNNTLSNPHLIIDNIPASGIHNGCRLLITQDSKIFITTGDASNGSNAQLTTSLSGKILRLNLDGSIPNSNPDPASPVWTKGHRNPQGLVYVKDRLYSSEHGPSNDDEINIIDKGRNYGWPNVEGYCDESEERSFCSKFNVVQPVYAWSPTLAVSGLDYYNNNRIPEWKNSLLLATLKDQTLYQLKLNDKGDKIESVNKIINKTFGRLRDVCITPDGKVFVCTGNGYKDKIIRVSVRN